MKCFFYSFELIQGRQDLDGRGSVGSSEHRVETRPRAVIVRRGSVLRLPDEVDQLVSDLEIVEKDFFRQRNYLETDSKETKNEFLNLKSLKVDHILWF
jgi:hypothetical protein